MNRLPFESFSSEELILLWEYANTVIFAYLGWGLFILIISWLRKREKTDE